MTTTQDEKLKELKLKFILAQRELDAFDIWFNENSKLLERNVPANKYQYRQDLYKFLENRKKFCNEDGTCNKGILFNSQAEFAFALFLELIGIVDFQTQTYIQDGQVDFFIPRLKLIIEIDGQKHYLGYKNGYLDKEETLKKITGTLQKIRSFQKTEFKIFRYSSDEIYHHRGDKPLLSTFFHSTLANDIINILQNEDDVEWVKFVKDIPIISLEEK